jgi:predicted phosphate transport protein (TIGR00153 family)
VADPGRFGYTLTVSIMFNFLPKEVRFYDYFEQQSENILKAAGLLNDLVRNFSDARAKTHLIKEVEHAGDLITHEIVRKLNTTFITPIDREDIHDLATRLDDVLDYIEAAAERLVVYRIKEPTSACRAMAEVIVKTAEATDRAIRCLRNMDPGFHEHAVEVNRLENTADNLLRDSLAALFDEQGDPIEVIKWKEIYETMEIVTDRCEDVANVIEGIILKMA